MFAAGILIALVCEKLTGDFSSAAGTLNLGVWLLTTDLAYRFFKANGAWLTPGKGGRVFWLPAWIWGALWVVSGTSQAVTGGWQQWTAPDGSYTVQFPGAPRKLQTHFQRDRKYSVKFGDGYEFTVIEMDQPVRITDPNGRLLQLRDAQVGDGHLLLDKSLSPGGASGIEYAYADRNEQVWHIRAFIKTNRYYQVISIAPKSKYRGDDPRTMRFLESFTFLDPRP